MSRADGLYEAVAVVEDLAAIVDGDHAEDVLRELAADLAKRAKDSAVIDSGHLVALLVEHQSSHEIDPDTGDDVLRCWDLNTMQPCNWPGWRGTDVREAVRAHAEHVAAEGTGETQRARKRVRDALISLGERVAAALALAEEAATWKGYETREIGHAYDGGVVDDFIADLRRALEVDRGGDS